VPKIFNESDKSVIRDNLLRLGLATLKNKGYKAASVEQIANEAGIAKGTFYNFFQSKEQFFYDVMLFIRDKNRNDFIDFISASERIDKCKLEKFLYERYANKENINHYFSSDELNIIFRKIADRTSVLQTNSLNFAAEIISGIPDINAKVNNDVVVNMINIIGRFAADEALASTGSREETIRILVRALSCYIFEGT